MCNEGDAAECARFEDFSCWRVNLGLDAKERVGEGRWVGADMVEAARGWCGARGTSRFPFLK